MKKHTGKMPLVVIIMICLVLLGGGSFFAMRFFRLRQENRQLEEQFARELQESRKTIDKLKEQEEDLDTRIADARSDDESDEQDLNGPEDEDDTEPQLLVSILACEPGELLPESALYMDNPGIYFTAEEIHEEDAVYQRIPDSVHLEDMSLDQLRYLKMPYYNLEGEIRVGEMIVNSSIAQEVLEGCLTLFREKYKISSMELETQCWPEEKSWSSLKNKLQFP